MNKPVMGLRVASVIFGLACLGQLTRLLLQLEIVVSGRHVPVWWSGVAALVLAALCTWTWKLSMPAKASSATGPATPHTPAAVS